MLALVALATGAGSALAETPLERGRYLVDAVMACDGCHTPRPGGVFDLSKKFSGGQQFEAPAYTVSGANISSDPDTGIGTWSEADLRRALTEGVRPNGVPLAPQMPFAFYRILTPGDLDAVVAYVRSVAPQRREMPTPVYRQMTYPVPIPGAEKSIGDTVPEDPVKRGFYLATIAHCMECHSRTPELKQDYTNWWGRGGAEFKTPAGSVVARNITSHKEKGIGAWTDAEIKRVLVEGIGRDGRKLALPMARQAIFSKMTDQDLNAIIAWVRTIPAAE